MRVVDKYLARQVIGAVLFVLVAFLALFAFFDLIGELKYVGRASYHLQHAFLYVILGMPGYAYDLMPIAALIGSIYALAQLAARSEFTILRVSSMSTATAAWILLKIGLLFVVITFLLGELVAPASTQMAERIKLQARDASISQAFRSGLWTKDLIRQDGLSGEVIGSRFVNVARVDPDGTLRGVRLYEFDRDFLLKAMINAAKAEYQGGNTWRLSEVTQTMFRGSTTGSELGVVTQTLPTKNLVSEITPNILSVLFTDPNRMSARDLYVYTRHLAENKQDTDRHEIAFWQKIFYPFAALVMMALALPFAYLHFRAGGVSLKIFIGIMIGVSFQLLNSLFSHLGLLNTWPPFTTAVLPSALFLLVAIAALRWVERH